MIREERIKKAALEYADAELIGIIDFKKEAAFIEGAEWADRTMIDKACEWLEQHLHHDNVGGFWADATGVEDFINQFKSGCSEIPNNQKGGGL